MKRMRRTFPFLFLFFTMFGYTSITVYCNQTENNRVTQDGLHSPDVSGQEQTKSSECIVEKNLNYMTPQDQNSKKSTNDKNNKMLE